MKKIVFLAMCSIACASQLPSIELKNKLHAHHKTGFEIVPAFYKIVNAEAEKLQLEHAILVLDDELGPMTMNKLEQLISNFEQELSVVVAKLTEQEPIDPQALEDLEAQFKFVQELRAAYRGDFIGPELTPQKKVDQSILIQRSDILKKQKVDLAIQKIAELVHKLKISSEFLKKHATDTIVQEILTHLRKLLSAMISLKGHTGSVLQQKKSAKSSYLISGSVDSTARIWQLPTWSNYEEFDRNQKVMTMLKPIIQTDHVRDIISRYMGNYGQSYILYGHREPVTQVALSSNGRYALTAAGDYAVSWCLDDPKNICMQQHNSSVSSVDFVDELCISKALSGEQICWNPVTRHVIGKTAQEAEPEVHMLQAPLNSFVRPAYFRK